jgi:hypothetical protein
MLNDYFRASDAETVAKLMIELDGGPVAPAVPDAVDGKNLDPVMVLGQLLAFALDAPSASRLVTMDLVWPAGAEDDGDYMGPWVADIGTRARDTLADITEDRMPGLAQRWAGIDELSPFSDMSPELMLSFLRQFVGLARTAREAGDTIYCWMSL